MELLILRCLFVLVASGVGVYIVQSGNGIYSFFGLLLFAVAIIGADVFFPKKRVGWISSLYFGVLIGLILTYAIHLATVPLFDVETNPGLRAVRDNFTLISGITLCYACVSLLFQTRDDFRFIIPYVEFQKDLKGNMPLILDTSVVIDGRIADIMETQIVGSRLVMPRFAIGELQRIADSTDRGRRTRGRRGLDILNRLLKMKTVDLQIDDTDLPEFKGQPVDLRLVALAKHMEGKLVTNDYNLNKVAKLHGVTVINLNDLANALKPVFLPGERLDVDIMKAGEEASQGIGYLDDGTMVVIDGGRDHVSEHAVVTVTSVLQTSAGRMIFAKYEYSTKKLAGTTFNQESGSSVSSVSSGIPGVRSPGDLSLTSSDTGSAKHAASRKAVVSDSEDKDTVQSPTPTSSPAATIAMDKDTSIRDGGGKSSGRHYRKKM